ncbi:MAG: hypothetical protein EOO65_03525, partial [Methanosarcinales archaeon]
MEANGVMENETLGVPEWVACAEVVKVVDGEPDGSEEGDAENEADPVTETVAVVDVRGVGERELEADVVGEHDAVGLEGTVGVTLGDGEPVLDRVAPTVELAVLTGLTDAELEREAEGVSVGVCVKLTLAVGVGVCVKLTLAVGVGVCV